MSGRGRGRPPSFDREIVLERAMEVFWEKGYEGAQLVDLTAAMGINPPSFYAAFGSKKDLFEEAVRLYVGTVGSKAVGALNSARTAREGLRAMLEANIDVACSNKSGGCLMVLGVVNNLSENQEVWRCLKAERVNMLALIRERIRRGIAEGDLPRETNTGVLASYFLGLTQMVSFQARDGATRAALRRLIEPALAALPSPGTAPS
ncbi:MULTISPECIES: TetR/AcrR family transcriptional regulator [Cupriavidus]